MVFQKLAQTKEACYPLDPLDKLFCHWVP